jgi:hypothetical protein
LVWTLKEHRLKVLENRMLRRIFGFIGDEDKGSEVTGGWIKLHNKNAHSSYSSPNIIMVIKSRFMGWVRYVVCFGEMRNVYKVLVIEAEGRDQSNIQAYAGR